MPVEDRPLLALTLGDTAGVGPEVVLKTLADAEARAAARMLVVGDGGLLAARARRLGLTCDLTEVASTEELRREETDAALLAGVETGADEGVVGGVNAEAGRASIAWVKKAAQLALAGEVDGIVTAPINKVAVKAAGFDHEGHTELLGEITGAEPVMMLVGGGLRVAIVTRHCALRDVPRLVTKDRVVSTARVVAEALVRDFGVARPRLGVLALNPHASDGGRFGDEEERVIAPAMAELRDAGVEAIGPLVPDVTFWRALSHAGQPGEYDAVVAMYHDQGLIPLKTLAFDRGVNATLGLPVVRTSPDHGTAFEIAREGRASHASMVEAVKLCAAMAQNRRRENA
jgi:4-hydroxythreonine-4-phosphate dehydrogenase